MSKWFLPFVLLLSSTFCVVTSGQCLSSCEPCLSSLKCVRCSTFLWGTCYNRDVYFYTTEWLCGDNCMLCCGDGSRYARFQCMRWANGTKLASAKYCWKVNQFLLHPYDESDSPDWRSSSPLDNTYQSHSFYTDPEEDDDYSTGWRLTIIWAAFVVFMVALTQYRRCVNTQRTSQESEEEEPLAAQIPSHSDPVPVQNASQGEVVVVVALDGEVDVGLKDQQ